MKQDAFRGQVVLPVTGASDGSGLALVLSNRVRVSQKEVTI
jgi:hypothetical protein